VTQEQAKTATLDELRAWLAEADGWRHDTEIAGPQSPHWYRYPNGMSWGVRHFGPHPHPPTRDGAAAALPKGWDFWKITAEWIAQGPQPVFVCTPDTGDEIADRYRLAVLCRLAGQKAPTTEPQSTI